MPTRHQLIQSYRASDKGNTSATELVAGWLASGYEMSDLLRLVGGLTTANILAGQSEAAHALYLN